MSSGSRGFRRPSQQVESHPSGSGTDHSESEERTGARVLRGLTWSVLSGGVNRTISFLAQIGLGWLLAKEDFGLYAIAVSVSAFAQALKDGGVRLLLIQRGLESFDNIVSSAFWLALASNLVAGVILGATAPIIADVYQQPQLVVILLFFAISLPLSTVASVLSAQLTLELRFRTIAKIEIVSALLRYSLIIGLAAAGMGALSFVIPLIAVAIYEGVANQRATHQQPWHKWPHPPTWLPLLRQAKWILVGTLAAAIIGQMDYLVLGLMAPVATVGIYFFAYQLSFQVINLLRLSIDKVLTPAFNRFRQSIDLRDRALIQLSRGVATVGPCFLLLMAVAISPLESILWRGRWEVAVGSIQIFSFILPIELLGQSAVSPLLSAGKFKFWSGLMAVRGVGLGFATVLAATVTKDVTTITAIIATYWALTATAQTVLVLRALGSPPINYFRAAVRGLGIGWGTAFLVLAADQLVLRYVADLLRLLLECGAFLTLWAIATRMGNAPALRDLAALSPPRMARIVSSVCRLESPHE